MVIQDLLVFHAKIGGDLEGEAFHLGKCNGTFFATSAAAATTYAEHSFMVNYLGDMEDYDEDFLRAAPALFPARLTIQNPAVLDRQLLLHIAEEVGIEPSKRERFADDFEDSVPTERNQVFAWLRKQGYDGAYLPRDSMPEAPCGDLCLRESFVSFEPQAQVKFALSQTDELGCRWSMAQDAQQLSKVAAWDDIETDPDEVRGAAPVMEM